MCVYVCVLVCVCVFVCVCVCVCLCVYDGVTLKSHLCHKVKNQNSEDVMYITRSDLHRDFRWPLAL